MFKKLFKSEGGFTLVELLVTIAILGVLFGIVTLTLTGVGSDAGETVTEAECGVVQAAADIYMAANNLATINDRTVADVIDSGDADADFKGFLRDLPTDYDYEWTDTGDVDCVSITW